MQLLAHDDAPPRCINIPWDWQAEHPAAVSLIKKKAALSQSGICPVQWLITLSPLSGPFQPSDDMMLMFYSYYKQATVGPCNIPRPSGFWDSRGRVKWYMISPNNRPGSSVRPQSVSLALNHHLDKEKEKENQIWTSCGQRFPLETNLCLLIIWWSRLQSCSCHTTKFRIVAYMGTITNKQNKSGTFCGLVSIQNICCSFL